MMKKNELIKNLEMKILRLSYPECKCKTEPITLKLYLPISLERVLVAFENGYKECKNCRGRGSYIKNIKTTKCKKCSGRGHTYEACLSDDKKLYKLSTNEMKHDDFKDWIINCWAYGSSLEEQSQIFLEILDQLL